MLMLERKKGQAFWVGAVEITVQSLSKGYVRLAIDGPRSVTVVRAEVLAKGVQPPQPLEQPAEALAAPEPGEPSDP